MVAQRGSAAKLCPTSQPAVAPKQQGRTVSPSMAGVLTVSETFKHARAAFLDPITTSRAHFLT